VHPIGLKADDLVTHDVDRYQAGLIAAIGATWTLMQMPTVATPRQVTGSGGSGTEWRRDNRRVSIIDLRRQDNQCGTAEPAGREYKTPLVRARALAATTTRASPRPAPTDLIPGHIKGPAGATPSRRGTRPRLAALTRSR